MTPEAIQMISQAKNTTTKRWKGRIKTAGAAAMLMQGIQDDLENIETNQQAALGSVRLKVRAPPPKVDWACPQCQTNFSNKQAMRMHEVAIHKDKHLAHGFLRRTNCPCCMCEYHTKRLGYQALEDYQGVLIKNEVLQTRGRWIQCRNSRRHRTSKAKGRTKEKAPGAFAVASRPPDWSPASSVPASLRDTRGILSQDPATQPRI